MPRTKKTTSAVAAQPQVIRSSGYDQNQMITLWNQGKSIEEIAKATGASTVWARRVISTKAPEAYKSGMELRHVATAALSTAAPQSAVPAGAKSVAQAIDVIARAVCQAAFSGATLTPQPKTREALFSEVSKGVRMGVKKLGIGFHA